MDTALIKIAVCRESKERVFEVDIGRRLGI
jgi:hypothetical protein